jgi:hypothetical protein
MKAVHRSKFAAGEPVSSGLEQSFKEFGREAFVFSRSRLSSFWRPNRVKLPAWAEHVPFAFWLTEALEPGLFVKLGTYSVDLLSSGRPDARAAPAFTFLPPQAPLPSCDNFQLSWLQLSVINHIPVTWNSVTGQRTPKLQK